MTRAQRRYVAIEATVGATISALLSVAFVLLLFGRLARVPVTGAGGLIVDGVPQGFAIALMATLVPTLLTRRRLARGAIAAIANGRDRARSASPFVVALAMGAAGAALTAGLTALLPLAGVDDLALRVVLAGKTLWGFVLGGVVAATMTRAALARG